MHDPKKIEIAVAGSPDRTELTVLTPAIVATHELTQCLERAGVPDARLGPARWMFDPVEQTWEGSSYAIGTMAGLTFAAPQTPAQLELAKQRVGAELERDGFVVTVLAAA